MLWVWRHRWNGLEFDWAACDVNGHVGLFATAGSGPVPDPLVEMAIPEASVLFDEIFALPVVTDAIRVAKRVGYMEDWFEIARRGVYAFDWSHGRKVYELVAAPRTPRAIDAANLKFLLPGGLPVEYRRLKILRVE